MDDKDLRTAEEIKTESTLLVKDVLRIAETLIEGDPKRDFVYANPLTADHRTRKRNSIKRESTEVPQPVQEAKKTIDTDYNESEVGSNTVDKPSESYSSPKKETERPSVDGFMEKENLNTQRSTALSKNFTEKSYLMKDAFLARLTKLTVDESARSTFESIRHDEEFVQWEESVSKFPTWNFEVDVSEESKREDSEGPELSKTILEKLVNFEWTTIGEFTIEDCRSNILNYVSLWKLSPLTKYTLLSNDVISLQNKWGDRYTFTVNFSKPTPMCPNPLAVARVFFDIYKSNILPTYYPINSKFRFEGYNSHYNTQGPENVRSVTFQMYFIESILNAKLTFYTELFELRNGPIDKETKKLSIEEENTLFDNQQEINTQQYLDNVSHKRKVPKPPTQEKVWNANVAEKVESQIILNNLIEKYKKRERVLKEFGFKEFLPNVQARAAADDHNLQSIDNTFMWNFKSEFNRATKDSNENIIHASKTFT